tara:strand:- start:812 stop:1039 length:228 start_codon:yes stop_codon:yes gene_type:complete
MTKKIRTYSTEFKVEAVKKTADNNGNISATSKQLGIAMQTLSNWHNKANQGKLKLAEKERDILKNSTAYFANEER